MLAFALLGARLLASQAFSFDVDAASGLTISAGGLPLVQGSGLQIYAPGWTRGYYSSTSGDATVDRTDPDTVRVKFAEGPASGTLTYRRDGPTLHVDETFLWMSDSPADVEVTAAKFWAPALAVSRFTADGKAMSSLTSEPSPSADMTARRIAPDGTTLSFAAPWGTLTVTPRGTPWFAFDARGYPQEYAVGKSLIWFGLLSAPLPKGQPVHVAFDLTVSVAAAQTVPVASLNPTLIRLANAEAAMDDTLPLAPNPKRAMLTSDRLELGGPFKFPAGRFFHFEEFKQALLHRFDYAWPVAGAPALVVDGGIHDMKLPHNAFQLVVRPTGFTVFGQDELGLRIGLRRLAMLVRSHDGNLFLPVGTITDWPSAPWRGVHLFVGPHAAPFQRELIERVLVPFGFNEAVLECERSAWTTLPNVRGPEVMSLTALADLFTMYRTEGMDAIPLVQSFGHMEWFFQNGANLDVAYNPNKPYGVDPRKARTKAILDKLWSEVIDVTQPKTIHFGCDEVDMVGWQPNPKLMTELWRQQMPILGDIAKAHGVSMMLWGDMALAPGEAIDATNGDNGTDSAARRAAIPHGSMIADWHYKADPHFENFFPSFETWKNDGLLPIASCWHEPDNVYGCTVAGVQQAAGVLKTTWCSSDSKASDAVTSFDEFAAMLLAGEYAWSGQQDLPSDLTYDYRDLFRRLFFAPPMPLQPVPGVGLSTHGDSPFVIGRYHFVGFSPVALRSSLSAAVGPEAVNLAARMDASTLVVACGCAMGGDLGAPVVRVTVTLEDGSRVTRDLRYGEDLRATSDPGVVPLAEQANGRYAAVVRLPKPGSRVVSIRVAALNAYSGFTLYGVTGF